MDRDRDDVGEKDDTEIYAEIKRNTGRFRHKQIQRCVQEHREKERQEETERMAMKEGDNQSH